MPAALELEDLVAAGGGARHAQREERRLGARASELDLVGARAGADHALGEADDRLVQEVVGRALRQLALDGGDDLRMGVAEQGRARAEVVVDEVAARDVGDVAAVAFGDHDVHFVGQDKQAEATTGKVAASTIEQIGLARSGEAETDVRDCGPPAALSRASPAERTCGRREGAVEGGEILLRQAQVERSAVVADVLRRAGFGNGDHALLTQHPRQARPGLESRRRARRRCGLPDGGAPALGRSVNRP